jgi:hypothetical protein
MKPSPASIAAVLALSKIISEGRVGMIYFAPDDMQIDWTPEAVAEVVTAVLTADRELVLGNWILDLLLDAGAKPDNMLKDHPDYERATKHWQAQEAYINEPFHSDDAEALHFDNIERNNDVRASK